jgi:hypothetical protein
MFIFSGIMALLYAGGFHDLPTGDLVSSIIANGLSGIKDSGIYTELTALLVLASGAIIVAGLFTRSPDFNLLKAGFVATFLGLFIPDLLWFYDKLISYGTWYAIIASIIFIPLIYGFIVSAVDWVGGSD